MIFAKGESREVLIWLHTGDDVDLFLESLELEVLATQRGDSRSATGRPSVPCNGQAWCCCSVSGMERAGDSVFLDAGVLGDNVRGFAELHATEMLRRTG